MLNKMRILLILLLTITTTSVNAFTLEFTQAELQEKVSAMMPLKKKKLFITIIFTNPVVKLIKTANRIGIKTNIQAMIPGGIKGSGTAEITGSLNYKPEEGAFYIKDPTITTLHINKVKDVMQPKIKKLAQTAISKTMVARPVYKLKDDNVRHKLAKSALKSITVNDGILVVEFSLF